MKRKTLILLLPILLTGLVVVLAQQPPRPRTHTIIKKGTLTPLPATSEPQIANEVTIEIIGDERVIRSNGIPDHKTGRFPNRGNPNRISAQRHEYRLPAKPKAADSITPMTGEFGVAVNGIPFDPGAAEFFNGEPGWQYEPLSGAIALGIDVSHAHVQPTGKYHYHGLPTGLLDSISLKRDHHSPLVGWAADGFPIYAIYGFKDPEDSTSTIVPLRSSFQLKKGSRPGGNAPGGNYDGTFVRDYEYVEGSGDLDQCNGRYTVTPDYPDGTYAYFMTEQWPVVPRNWRGTASSDFLRGPGGGRPPRGSTSERGGRMAASDQRRPAGDQNPARGFNDRAPRDQRESGRTGGPPGPGVIIPPFLLPTLRLTEEQNKQLQELQGMVDDKLEKILTPEQMQRLTNPRFPRGTGGFGPQRGQRAFPPGQGPRGF